jgi:hypothetical protein
MQRRGQFERLLARVDIAGKTRLAQLTQDSPELGTTLDPKHARDLIAANRGARRLHDPGKGLAEEFASQRQVTFYCPLGMFSTRCHAVGDTQ